MAVEHHIGEGFSVGIEKQVGLHTNRSLSRFEKAGINAEIDLGELGVHGIENVRFRVALKQGHLQAYIRHEIGEHKGAVIATTIAFGVVIAGLSALKHRQK